MVGARGFEPPTSASRTLRATKLRYAPTRLRPPVLDWDKPRIVAIFGKGSQSRACLQSGNGRERAGPCSAGNPWHLAEQGPTLIPRRPAVELLHLDSSRERQQFADGYIPSDADDDTIL